MKRGSFNWLTCLGFVVGTELVGNIGSLATFSQINSWYATLVKPSFNPPNWIFGPVWTILYALMGIALYLVWLKGLKKSEGRLALGAFALQLILNVKWSFLFFGLHWPLVAFVEIVLLWLAIVLTIRTFSIISKPAAWFLVPYLLWVSFAAALNFAIWYLN